MKEVVATGKTVEEAIDAALAQLGLPREEADITVLELPSKGLLGLLPGKEAKVHVRELYDPVLFASEWMERFLEKMNMGHARAKVVKQDEGISVDIQGRNLGALIGRKGQTLDSLQYILTLAVNKKGESFIPVTIDAGNYRKKRQQAIEREAQEAAQKVKATGQRVMLKPMSAAERRIAHLVLAAESGITTYSTGEEPLRRVVIEKKAD